MRLGWWRRSGDVRLAEDKLPARPKLQAGPSPNLGAWWNQPAASEKEAHQAHYHLYWKGGRPYHQTHRIIYHPYPFQLPRVIIYESVQLVLFVIADTRRSRVNVIT